MTDITELTGAPKHANQHRISRLIVEAPNDELRQLAVEVEQYTDQLIEALEKAQTENTAGTAGMAESYETTISMLRSRIAELESKLANPVQLPKTNGYWTEQEKAYEEAITLAKRQVRLAGFQCEGDESFTCPRCGRTTTHPEGWHYCHKREAE
ncbi:TPA: hypothetical protein R1886_003942 [Klebsiella oxytoca]|nr:hypothetical protein [Klebsiella oxytoca]